MRALALMVPLTMALSSLPGCALLGRDLQQAGAVTVERVPSDKVTIRRVAVRQVHSEVVISGELRREDRWPHPHVGHLDVDILNPAGQRLRCAAAAPRPQLKGSRHTDRATFWVEMPAVPPPGSTIRLAYHEEDRGPHGC